MHFTGWESSPVVLVVEDEPLIAMDLEGMLSDAGCVVVGPTATAQEALALIATNRLDCAVLDVQLGEGSSSEVADMLAERDIPFVVTTGLREVDLENTALRAASVLTKPILQERLVGEVKRLARRRPQLRVI